MTDPHDLTRLSFPAVRRSVRFPPLSITNGIAGLPEFRCHSCVMGILVKLSNLAVANFATGFHTETKILPQIVNAPADIRVEQYSLISGTHKFFKFCFAWFQIDVGHSN